MCGIVGYIGNKEAVPVLLDGLTKLEYRGYDSAGICVAGADGSLRTVKSAGKVARLLPLTTEVHGRCGIAHTRWATHGAPSEVNAHPHLDGAGNIAVVHNGIIENYRELKASLLREGVAFRSETDSEVIALAETRLTQISGTDFTFPSRNPRSCIDYIFCFKDAAPVEVLSHRVITEGTADLSDHLPLVVKVTF